MTKFKLLLSACSALIFSIVNAQTPLHYVDPFIGVYGGGNVHPAATLPYSLISLGPDVDGVQSPSGYYTVPFRYRTA